MKNGCGTPQPNSSPPLHRRVSWIETQLIGHPLVRAHSGSCRTCRGGGQVPLGACWPELRRVTVGLIFATASAS